MLRKLFILTIFCLLRLTQLYSQTPSFYHYTSSDGLASSTVYQIIQDKDGFIWFATANGLSKFDGQHFTTFRTIDGLNSNSITSLVENENGELYIGNFEKGINVLKNGKIKNYYSDINWKSLSISFLMLDPSENNEQNILAYGRMGEINLISENKSSGQITNVAISTPVLINKLEKLQNGNVITLTTTGLFNLKDKSFSKLHVNGLPNINISCLTSGDESSYFIGAKGMIFKLKNDTVINSYKIELAGDNDVVAILYDKNKNIWFSIMNKGFYLIPNDSDKIIDIGSKLGLQNTLVNSYFEDNEGNIWVSTFGKGVYCINNLYLKNYNENDGLSSNNVYSIAKGNNDKLFLGTFNGISVLENGKIDRIKNNTNNIFNEYIYNIKNIANEFYVSAALGVNETINISYDGMNLHLIEGLSFCKLSNGLCLFGTRVNSIKVQKTLNSDDQEVNILYVFGYSQIKNRINDIFEDSEKNIWIATGLGLCKASIQRSKTGKLVLKKSFFKTNPVLNSRINSIYQDNRNNIWFSGEKGIARYNLKNDSVKSFTNINGYDLSSSTSIVTDNKNRIWIGNMKGLFLFDGKNIKQLNRQTGLPSNEVLSLLYDKEKNQLGIGTSNGITFLDISLFDSYSPKPLNVIINTIKAGDSVYSSFKNLVFKPEQNKVYIDFN